MCKSKVKLILISTLIVAFVVGISATYSCKPAVEPVVEKPAEETVEGEPVVEEELVVEEPVVEEELVVEEPVELVVWWWGEQDTPGLEKYLENRGQAFKELYPNVTTTFVLQATDTTIPNFEAAAAAGKGPDIATMWYGVYQLEVVWAGHVEPLDNWIEEEEYKHWIGRSPLSMYDGRLWASDLYCQGFPIYYNKDHFRTVGLDPEKPPKTWDEFIQYCEIFKNAGIDPIAMGWSDAWGTFTIGTHLWNQKITSEKFVRASVGEYSFTDPDFKDAWDKLYELISNDYFIEGAASLNQAQGWREWARGEGVFTFSSSQPSIEFYNELGPEKMGYMMAPSLTGEEVGDYYTFPLSLLIPVWSPNKAIAAEFLKFLHTQESMNKMIEMLDSRIIPADDRFDVNQIKDPLVRELNQRIINGLIAKNYSYDALAPWGIIGDGILVAGGKIFSGEIDADEAAQLVQDAAETWRDLNPEVLENLKKWIEEF